MSNAPQSNQAITELLVQLEERRRNALVSKDFTTLATLFTDDLVYIHSTGVVQDKAAYLHHAQTALAFLSIERSNLKVRVFGDLAVMTGDMTNTITAPSLPAPMVVQAHVTQVWNNNTEAGWQMVNFQATRLPV